MDCSSNQRWVSWQDCTHNEGHKNYSWKWLGSVKDLQPPLDRREIFLFQRITLQNINSIRTWLEVWKRFLELLVYLDKFIKQNNQSRRFWFTLQHKTPTLYQTNKPRETKSTPTFRKRKWVKCRGEVWIKWHQWIAGSISHVHVHSWFSNMFTFLFCIENLIKQF